jgi:hypothetical protein
MPLRFHHARQANNDNIEKTANDQPQNAAGERKKNRIG